MKVSLLLIKVLEKSTYSLITPRTSVISLPWKDKSDSLSIEPRAGSVSRPATMEYSNHSPSIKPMASTVNRLKLMVVVTYNLQS